MLNRNAVTLGLVSS